MHRVKHIMGMPIVVAARDGDVPEEVFDWFRHVDETFSTFKEESEVSRIRRDAEAHPAAVAAALIDLDHHSGSGTKRNRSVSPVS